MASRKIESDLFQAEVSNPGAGGRGDQPRISLEKGFPVGANQVDVQITKVWIFPIDIRT